MSALFDGPAPRVFHVPPGVDFSAEFARGLRLRLSGLPPETLARVRIFTNARRTARAVEAALEETAGGDGGGGGGAPGGATWLPRFAYVNALGVEAAGLGVAPAVDPLRRRLALMRLVEAFLRAEPEFGDAAAAPALSETLADLLDDLQGAGLTAEAVAGIQVGEHAHHWDLTRRFLRILTDVWPAHLAEAEGGAIDPQARRRAAAEALARSWAEAPPPGPVIAAGSTGSTPATAILLAAVARLPQGAVVLPGLDPETPAALWEPIAERHAEHPQHMLARLCAEIGVSPADSAPWTDAAPPNPARLRLLSQALRPAPVTDAWFAARPALAAEAVEATREIDLIEAESPRREAAAIAVALAEAALAGAGTAALVTPDRVLARRVSAELARWSITPDDSAGPPLDLTPPGALLGLLAGCVGRPMKTAALAAILRHPLVGGRGAARGAHQRMRLALERAALRGGPTEIDWPLLGAALRDAPGADPRLLAWFDRLRATLEPLSAPPASLSGALAAHRAAAETLSRGWTAADETGAGAGAEPGAAPGTGADGGGAGADGAGEPPIWDLAAGEAARAFLDRLAAAVPAYDDIGAAPPAGYGALFGALISGEETRTEAQRVHDRIFIRGTLEARAQSADLVILGGLNDGTWPRLPQPEAWLSRPMRAALGLTPPEARIGLAAHDFLQAANARRVILTRSVREGGAPTVASRWLIRLTNLLGGVDEGALTAMRARGAAWLRAAQALTHADPVDPAPRPAPTPPVSARPRGLSVTRVETLIRDPYAIYARHVLGLIPLEPLGRQPDARDKGTAIHAIFERLTEETRAWTAAQATPDAFRDRLLAIAREELARQPGPAIRRLWLKRLERAADWLAGFEAERRRLGVPLMTEARGEAAFDAPGGRFRLSGRADRIDRLDDGRLAILDYKTGAPPGVNEIKVFAKQLALLGAIAERGGFPDLPGAEIGALTYVGLGGGADGAGKLRDVPVEEGAVAQAWDGLRRLIAAYDDPAAPYRARLRPRHLKYAGDYDHLARYGEWGDDAEGEEDA